MVSGSMNGLRSRSGRAAMLAERSDVIRIIEHEDRDAFERESSKLYSEGFFIVSAGWSPPIFEDRGVGMVGFYWAILEKERIENENVEAPGAGVAVSIPDWARPRKPAGGQVLVSKVGKKEVSLTFECPGCKTTHRVTFDDSPRSFEGRSR